MYQYILIPFLLVSSLYSNWLNEENLKTYPSKYMLQEVEIENNSYLIEPNSIYKQKNCKNISLSSDGKIWFQKDKKEEWIVNPYSTYGAVNMEDKNCKLYYLKVLSPLLKTFKKDIYLNQKLLRFSKDEIEEDYYFLNKDTKVLNFDTNGSVIIDFRIITNEETNTNIDTTFTYILNNQKKEIKLNLANDIKGEKKFNNKQIYTSIKKRVQILFPNDKNSLSIKFSKPVLVNISLQQDINKNILIDKDFKHLDFKEQISFSPDINNSFINDAQFQHTQELNKISKQFQYSSIWNEGFQTSVKKLAYKTIYPYTLSSGTHIYDAYFLLNKLENEDDLKINHLNPNQKLSYLLNINSGTFIGQDEISGKNNNKTLIKEIHYSRDSAILIPNYLETLKNIFIQFQHENYDKLELVGHTDKRASKSYNLKLSKQRIQSIGDTLIRLGMNKEQLVFTPKGESQLKSLKDDDESHFLNRRVEVYGIKNYKNPLNEKLVYLLPKSTYGHWIRFVVQKNFNENITIELDDKKFATIRFDDKRLLLKNNIAQELIKKNPINEVPFLWYKEQKNHLDVAFFEFYIKKGSKLTLKTDTKKLPLLIVQRRSDSEYFLNEDELINLFSKEKSVRENIVKQALFKNGEYSNGFYVLKEYLNSKVFSFENSIDKSTQSKPDDIELAKMLSTHANVNSAIKISKYLFYKYQNKEAKELLKKYYATNNSENIKTLKSVEFIYTKDIKHLEKLSQLFYQNSSFKLALLSSLSGDLTSNTYKIALKLKLFRLAKYLKSKVKDTVESELIFKKVYFTNKTDTKIIEINNKNTEMTHTKILLSNRKSTNIDVNSSGVLQIQTRALMDTDNSKKSWLKIKVSDKIYISPLYASVKNDNLKVKNKEKYVGASQFHYLKLDNKSNRLEIEILGDSHLASFKIREIDFKNRFPKKKIENKIKTTFSDIYSNTNDDKLEIIKLLYHYEKSGDKNFAVKGFNICLKHENDHEFNQLCKRIKENLYWERYDEFISSAGEVRVAKKYGETNNENLKLKRKLLDNQNYTKLISVNSKFTYQILGSKKKVGIDLRRVSYRYHKQNEDMVVSISLNDKKQNIVLPKGGFLHLDLPLKEEINILKIEMNTQDQGSFLDIKINNEIPTYKTTYHLSNKNEKLQFIADNKNLYRINYDNKKVEYRYIDTKESKDRVVEIPIDSKVKIYKLKHLLILKDEKIPKQKKQERMKKKRLDTPLVDLFNVEQFKNNYVIDEHCLKYYSGVFETRKASSDDSVSQGVEKFFQLSHDTSCFKQPDYTNLNVFARKHINNEKSTIFGSSLSYFNPLYTSLSFSSKIDGKIDLDENWRLKVDADFKYNILRYQEYYFYIHFGGFGSILNNNSTITQYVDKDIYTDYKNEHKYGMKSAFSVYTKPFEDTILDLKFGLLTNPNFSIDNIYSTFTWVQLWNMMESNLRFHIKEYQVDNKRVKSSLSKRISLNIKSYSWFSKSRGELFGKINYDIKEENTYVGIGLRIYFNNHPLYKNSYPGKEKFKDLKSLKDWDYSHAY